MSETSTTDSLPCILIPLQQHYLLLPNDAVIAVSPYSELTEASDKPESWVGEYSWNNQQIPVIDLESLVEEKPADLEGIKKLCIVRSINADNSVTAYALTGFGSSQLIQINQTALQLATEVLDSSFLHCQIQIGNKVAYIPNLDNIEVMLDRNQELIVD